jgi:hypothetical protein
MKKQQIHAQWQGKSKEGKKEECQAIESCENNHNNLNWKDKQEIKFSKTVLKNII